MVLHGGKCIWATIFCGTIGPVSEKNTNRRLGIKDGPWVVNVRGIKMTGSQRHPTWTGCKVKKRHKAGLSHEN